MKASESRTDEQVGVDSAEWDTWTQLKVSPVTVEVARRSFVETILSQYQISTWIDIMNLPDNSGLGDKDGSYLMVVISWVNYSQVQREWHILWSPHTGATEQDSIKSTQSE